MCHRVAVVEVTTGLPISASMVAATRSECVLRQVMTRISASADQPRRARSSRSAAVGVASANVLDAEVGGTDDVETGLLEELAIQRVHLLGIRRHDGHPPAPQRRDGTQQGVGSRGCPGPGFHFDLVPQMRVIGLPLHHAGGRAAIGDHIETTVRELADGRHPLVPVHFDDARGRQLGRDQHARRMNVHALRTTRENQGSTTVLTLGRTTPSRTGPSICSAISDLLS